MLTREERETLRKLAGEATPGPWYQAGVTLPGIEVRAGDGTEIAYCHHDHKSDELAARYAADFSFIAAMSPSTTLALLDQIEELEAEREKLERIVWYLSQACKSAGLMEITEDDQKWAAEQIPLIEAESAAKIREGS